MERQLWKSIVQVIEEVNKQQNLAVGESGLTAWPCNTSPKRQRVNTSEAQYVHSLALRLVVGRIQHSF